MCLAMTCRWGWHGYSRQLPKASEWRCEGRFDSTTAATPSSATIGNLQLSRLLIDLCSKPCFFFGSWIFSEPLLDGMGKAESTLNWENPENPQTHLLFSHFFSPKGIWHGPSHPRGANKNRNWSRVTGRPFWNREKAQLSILAPSLGLPNSCAAE